MSSTPESRFGGLHPGTHYAVIFSSQRHEGDEGYGAMADRMVELAQGQAGFLGIESARDASGFGITVCYWSSLEAIAAWKAHAEHLAAQAQGIRQWYGHYELRVVQVLRAYAGPGQAAPTSPAANAPDR